MELGTPVLALLLGISAGMRTFTPLAVVSAAVYFGIIQVSGLPAYLGSTFAFVVLLLFAAGELVADKTSLVPDRTSVLPLIGRVFSGGFCGHTIAVAASASGVVSAGAGILGAVAGTYGGFSVRRYLTKRRGVPDVAVAFVEDAVSISLAVLACYLAA